MIVWTRRLVVMAFAVVVAAGAGCGDSKVDDKQPKLQGKPDPRIKGPATPGKGASPAPKSL